MSRLGLIILVAVLFCRGSVLCFAGVGDDIPLSSIRSVSLAARPIVRQGDSLPLELEVSLDRSKPIECMELFTVRDLRIDGKVVDVPPLAEQLATYQSRDGVIFESAEHGASAGDWSRPIGGAITSRLSLGKHTISAKLRLERFNADGIDYDAAGHSFFLYSGHPTTSPANKPADVQDVSVTTTFVICDSAHEPPVTIVDPNLRKAMRTAAQIQPLAIAKDGSCIINLMMQYPPKRCEFDLEVRSAVTHDVLLASDGVSCEENSQGGIGTGFTPPPDSPAKVDVILRPDVDSARRQVDNTPIWGESIVFRDVVVVRPSTEPSSLKRE